MFRRKRAFRGFVTENEAQPELEEDQFHARGPTLWWDHLWREMRSAVRALARERAFAAFAILLIALGAGLVTTMFALVDAVSLRKLDVPNRAAAVAATLV